MSLIREDDPPVFVGTIVGMLVAGFILWAYVWR